jgi:AcrR family transcriptional regulator
MTDNTSPPSADAVNPVGLSDDPKGHRRRLLQGMARAVAVRGYSETTIADIVREANVSRRTFYEHFADKAECLVALYEASTRSALQVLRDAIDPGSDWPTQVEAALRAYFRQLSSNPGLTRSLFVDILNLGIEGMQARRRMFDALADFIVQTARPGQRGRQRVPRDHALAIVGAINELVLDRLESNRTRRRTADQLDELAPLCVQLVRRLAD